jgi:hypothetical protein
VDDRFLEKIEMCRIFLQCKRIFSTIVEFFYNCTELGGLIFRKDRRKGMFENFPGNID